jgi:hypothetical protein
MSLESKQFLEKRLNVGFFYTNFKGGKGDDSVTTERYSTPYYQKQFFHLEAFAMAFCLNLAEIAILGFGDEDASEYMQVHPGCTFEEFATAVGATFEMGYFLVSYVNKKGKDTRGAFVYTRGNDAGEFMYLGDNPAWKRFLALSPLIPHMVKILESVSHRGGDDDNLSLEQRTELVCLHLEALKKVVDAARKKLDGGAASPKRKAENDTAKDEEAGAASPKRIKVDDAAENEPVEATGTRESPIVVD